MSARRGVVCVNGWAGRREYPVLIIAETRARYRVQAIGEVRLPRRTLANGEVALVPKSAVRVTP